MRIPETLLPWISPISAVVGVLLLIAIWKQRQNKTTAESAEQYGLRRVEHLLRTEIDYVSFAGLRGRDDPVVEFGVVARNACPFDIDITGLNGRVRCRGEECNAETRLMTPSRAHSNASLATYVVHQPVTSQMAQTILGILGDGGVVDFDLSGVKLKGVMHLSSSGDEELPPYLAYGSHFDVQGPISENDPIATKERLRLRGRTRPSDNGLGLSGSLTVETIPGPASPRVRSLQYDTKGRIDEEIDVGGRPQALRFTKPIEEIVRAQDLPAKIACDGGWFLVKKFTNRGYTVEEHTQKPIGVHVEFYPKGTRSP